VRAFAPWVADIPPDPLPRGPGSDGAADRLGVRAGDQLARAEASGASGALASRHGTRPRAAWQYPWLRIGLRSAKMSRLTRRPARDAVLRLIAVFKLLKGLLLLILGLATINLRHKDITDALGAWVDQLHLDPGGRLVRAVLFHAADLKARRLVAISAGMFVYAALLFTEGTGLLFRKRWAEYFTVIVTASFVPLELYEIGRHATGTRIVVLGINVAIVWYLIIRLRRDT
jgi:uncharacterized membrane protein (DUF2068 family)